MVGFYKKQTNGESIGKRTVFVRVDENIGPRVGFFYTPSIPGFPCFFVDQRMKGSIHNLWI